MEEYNLEIQIKSDGIFVKFTNKINLITARVQPNLHMLFINEIPEEQKPKYCFLL